MGALGRGLSQGSGVTIVGLPEALTKVNAIAAKMGPATLVGARAGALVVQNAAKIMAPYKTGNLRRSIHQEVIAATPTLAEVSVGTDVEYAAAQEFGFEGYAGKPYLRPALDETRTQVIAAVASGVRRALGVL